MNEDTKPLSLKEQLKNLECTIIIQSLIDNGGNESKTARSLQISRTALRYKLKEYRERGLLEEVRHDS